MVIRVIHENTVCAAARLSAHFTAHLGRSCSVLSPAPIQPLRASPIGQGKAQVRSNSPLLQGPATPHWPISEAPFGRAGKRQSAALRLLEIAGLSRRKQALQHDTCRPAE